MENVKDYLTILVSILTLIKLFKENERAND